MFAFVNVELFIAMIAINVIGVGLWFAFNKNYMACLMKGDHNFFRARKELAKQIAWNLGVSVPWIGGLIADWKTTLLASVVLTALLPVVVKIVYAKTMRTIVETL